MEQCTVRLRVANITDIGRNPARTKNEDFYGYYEGDYGHLFLVCDGMGGHEGGEIASRVAVESIRKYFETSYIPGEELKTISQSVEFAQGKILEAAQHDPDLADMGTTLVLMLIKGAQYWQAHVGDSRIYLSRGGALLQLTKDHSEVQMMLESGVITREQASTHPRRNFITKSLGHSSFEPDIAGPRVLQQDDVFLLCSDGLTQYIKDDELLQQMEEEPSIACHNLVDIANQRGGDDNITVQIVHVQQCTTFSLRQEVPAPPKKKFSPSLAMIATIVVFLGAVIWYSLSLTKVPEQQATELQAPKPKKEKKRKASTRVMGDTQLQTLEQAIGQRLAARDADPAYQEYFAKIASHPGQAQNLKFITNPQGKQMAYILPRHTIYLAFNQLQDKGGYNMKADEIQALIALALVRSEVESGLEEENWQTELFAPGTAAVDEQTYNAARELYRKYDPENAAVLFASDRRFGKYRNLIKLGEYNLSLDMPRK
ncbi:MAG: Stp1/IreP family PP2C-type Ser/Thr phosphatase [Candidatus Syntrophosphaera sp.]|nr:Stp1/IreP family PP2C-type Ser/Thr phosphatase [Candidatus Syntrophosphaera sp.]